MADGAKPTQAGRTTASDEVSFRARLLEAVEQAVIATDTQARILYWNQGAERLYGWRAEEVLGRNATEVIVSPRTSANASKRNANGSSACGSRHCCSQPKPRSASSAGNSR